MAENKNRPSINSIGKRVRRVFESAREGQEPEAVVPGDGAQTQLEEARAKSEMSRITVVESVPRSLRVAAAVSWRALVVCVAVGILGYVIFKLWSITVAVMLALLFTVLLEPVLRGLLYLRFSRTLAAAISLLFGVALLFGLLSLASTQIVTGISDLWGQAQVGIGKAVAWLWDGPLHLDQQKVLQYWMDIRSEWGSFARRYSSTLATGAINVTTSVTTAVTLFLIIIFCVFFFLKDGRKIWQWFVRLLPVNARNPVNEAFIRGWVTLGSYARTQALVAALDALCISGAAFFMGLPLWFPLAILVFIGAFIPYLGAITVGTIAVLVALVDQGLTSAIIMLIVILVVGQLEGNLFSPLLMSNAVDLHPVAVLLAVTGAGYMFGILGAMFAVPVAAFVNTVVLYFYGHDKFMRLQYDVNRPGGPPGTLDEEIDRSLMPTKNNVRECEEARKKYGVSPQVRAQGVYGGPAQEHRIEEVRDEIAAEDAAKSTSSTKGKGAEVLRRFFHRLRPRNATPVTEATTARSATAVSTSQNESAPTQPRANSTTGTVASSEPLTAQTSDTGANASSHVDKARELGEPSTKEETSSPEAPQLNATDSE